MVEVVPVPLSAMVCGEPLALSVRVMVALKLEAVAGVKVAEIVQEALMARVEPQVVVSANSLALVPPRVMLVMFSVAVPVLVSVTLVAALVEPTAVLGKAMLVAERVALGAVLLPVPLSAMVCGEPLALSVRVMVAL